PSWSSAPPGPPPATTSPPTWRPGARSCARRRGCRRPGWPCSRTVRAGRAAERRTVGDVSTASETETAGANTQEVHHSRRPVSPRPRSVRQPEEEMGSAGVSETRATGPQGDAGAEKEAAGGRPGIVPARSAAEAGPADPEAGAGPPAVPLLEPREGVPAVVAVDAERASGYRYGQRAYLIQMRRAGAGTALIDPIACPDLSGLDAALADTEMVLHAANQDLPCLAEVGLVPRRLFDTELAGRLLGYPRVGLGSMVENVLGYVLEKGHSAADWSTRPLPEDWLRYAALDVELLIELRDALEEELEAAGKLEWAREEFDAILATPPKPPRPDPWRRTSGI